MISTRLLDSEKAARSQESVLREVSRICALEDGRLVRLCFAKRLETLERAVTVLQERLP